MAEYLGVCTAVVYALVERGELPHVRVSNAIRVSASDVALYVRNVKTRNKSSMSGIKPRSAG